ncbi:diguanylate cyclase [Clostridium magnum]|uniref:Stage 0 sporulation protein A homolog n=1 Tax=Clostridium magnum DSM 2767 TaxID=1121326 RepID=A0A161WIT6_9CLOT|nr:diguanylate cyclase [Clostridium magnum]KZL91615.1 response regulator PleD [Clostridium magnum DSM 2767]SHH49571.1 diguanylate cyclase (GGDEF) domain-containing protein [Clostridium magnum DSM 2767]
MAKILVVDDEQFNVILLTKRLSKLGYEVLQAKNGHDALKLLDEHLCDLILLDIMMPDMDGFEVAKKILGNPDQKEIPIIFLTAKTSIEDKLEGLTLGAVDYITKPFDFRELQVRIKIILKKNETKNKLLEESKELKEAACTDFLTGLLNRRHIDQVLKNLFNDCNQDTSSLLLMDLDYFKKINDTYGHDQGDIVLKGVAKILKNSIRNSDTVARYGGEEFIAILPSASKKAAFSIAERIRINIEQKIFNLNGQEIHITISIGSATLIREENKYQILEEWIQAADKALYKAKNNGRNLVVQV